MLYLLINFPTINIDCLFIDEAHKITNLDRRSPFYYKITNMLNQRDYKTNIIFASPNIPNPDEYIKLTTSSTENTDNAGAFSLSTSFSPVTHFECLVNLTDNWIKVYNQLTDTLDTILTIKTQLEKISFIKEISKINKNSQNIIYCSSRKKAVNYANDFAKYYNDLNDTDLNKLASEIKEDIHSDYYLPDLIKKGITFHVGYLPNYMRFEIEKLYKLHKIHTLFCTSTLAKGGNLPTDNLFVLSYMRASRYLSPIDFKNLIGRVGKIKYNLFGNIYLVKYEDDQIAEKYKELVKSEVPEQKLELQGTLSKNQKIKIVDSLLTANIKLIRYPKKQTKDNYSLMRKFALFLLKDITSNSNSLIVKEFNDMLDEDKKSKLKISLIPKIN